MGSSWHRVATLPRYRGKRSTSTQPRTCAGRAEEPASVNYNLEPVAESASPTVLCNALALTCIRPLPPLPLRAGSRYASFRVTDSTNAKRSPGPTQQHRPRALFNRRDRLVAQVLVRAWRVSSAQPQSASGCTLPLQNALRGFQAGRRRCAVWRLCGEAGRHSIGGSRTWACSCLGRPHSASQTARGSPAPHAARFTCQHEREPAVACCTPEHTTPPDASALHLASQTARHRRGAGAPPGRRGPGRTSWLEMEVMVAAASSIIRHVACLQAQARGRGARVSWAHGARARRSARAGRRWSGRRCGGRGRAGRRGRTECT